MNRIKFWVSIKMSLDFLECLDMLLKCVKPLAEKRTYGGMFKIHRILNWGLELRYRLFGLTLHEFIIFICEHNPLPWSTDTPVFFV